jgi:hypothetical protein
MEKLLMVQVYYIPGINSVLPVAVDNSGILSGKSMIYLSTGIQHTCVIYSKIILCFYIQFNDTSVCRGNGKFIIFYCKKIN